MCSYKQCLEVHQSGEPPFSKITIEFKESKLPYPVITRHPHTVDGAAWGKSLERIKGANDGFLERSRLFGFTRDIS